jgi:hypothetical protein
MKVKWIKLTEHPEQGASEGGLRGRLGIRLLNSSIRPAGLFTQQFYGCTSPNWADTRKWENSCELHRSKIAAELTFV